MRTILSSSRFSMETGIGRLEGSCYSVVPVFALLSKGHDKRLLRPCGQIIVSVFSEVGKLTRTKKFLEILWELLSLFGSFPNGSSLFCEGFIPAGRLQ